MVGDNSESNFELNFYKKFTNKNSIIFDVGARDSTIPYLNEESIYHLFEPIKYNFYKLIEHYKDRKNVNIYNLGLSDKIETVNIYVESESIYKRNGYNYVWDRVNPTRVANGDTEVINCDTLENFIKKNNIKKIDLLKVDVEGYEYNVIKGLYSYLDIVNCFVFEYSIHTYNDSGKDLLTLLDLFNNHKFFIIENNKIGYKELPNNKNDIYNLLKNNHNCNIVVTKNGQHIF